MLKINRKYNDQKFFSGFIAQSQSQSQSPL